VMVDKTKVPISKVRDSISRGTMCATREISRAETQRQLIYLNGQIIDTHQHSLSHYNSISSSEKAVLPALTALNQIDQIDTSATFVDIVCKVNCNRWSQTILVILVQAGSVKEENSFRILVCIVSLNEGHSSIPSCVISEDASITRTAQWRTRT